MLSIWFVDSVRYVYSDVPPSIYEALCASVSAGRCYNEMVKSRFPCRFDPERRRFRPGG